jgi:hypothetical protein
VTKLKSNLLILARLTSGKRQLGTKSDNLMPNNIVDQRKHQQYHHPSKEAALDK